MVRVLSHEPAEWIAIWRTVELLRVQRALRTALYELGADEIECGLEGSVGPATIECRVARLALNVRISLKIVRH